MTSSQEASSSVETALPGAAEKLSFATASRGGTRWSAAEIVVERMRGLSPVERERARRESTVIRRAAIEALGESRS